LFLIKLNKSHIGKQLVAV